MKYIVKGIMETNVIFSELSETDKSIYGEISCSTIKYLLLEMEENELNHLYGNNVQMECHEVDYFGWNGVIRIKANVKMEVNADSREDALDKSRDMYSSDLNREDLYLFLNDNRMYKLCNYGTKIEYKEVEEYKPVHN